MPQHTDSQPVCKLIYDIGAHRGEDTAFYLKRGFRVIAVEANPILCQEIKERFKSNIADGSLVLIEGAIAESNRDIPFYMNESQSCWGTIRPDWAHRNQMLGSPSKTITVKGIHCGEILKRYGIPHYMKVDIEGADLLCLEALAACGDKPQFVSIESEKKSWEALLREFAQLQKLGYNRFKIIDQGTVAQQRVPKPAREGLPVNHQFEAGASGLFGDELPGRWLTMDEALQRYRRIFRQYRLFGDFGLWRRNIVVRIMRRIPFIGRWFRATWFDTHATRG